ncbi:hypothetical protein POM88_033126 [Heracleum sosnowskyi]|uniref:Uncharacterized protein n=1 Tax=Heracleum sosnowskyi TaxID=360622 RepID=A0AAD8I2Z8_9APIA|nr:hypothetical protein POM88_033126 [Heracleum sosnowskyi]
MEQNMQIFANNYTVTSLPPLTSSPWNPNTNMTSYSLINQEESLPQLPSDQIPCNLYLDSTTSNLIRHTMTQHSLLPPLPSKSEWNVNPDSSTMPLANNNVDQEHLLPRSPSEIPWNLARIRSPKLTLAISI